jgi:organic radical activating enzyme
MEELKLDLLKLDVTTLDFPEKDAISVITYLGGCDRKCCDCQSLSLQEKREGESVDIIFEKILKYLAEVELKKLVLSGGDPLADCNYKAVVQLLNKFSEEAPEIIICIYTGAELSEINDKVPMLPNIKYIKGGKFDRTKLVKNLYPQKTNYGLQLASTNQFFVNTQRKLLTIRGFLEF